MKPRPLAGALKKRAAAMKDPLDNQTLDLVEAASQPLSPAQRQKRHRQKLKELREKEGLRDVRLTLEDLGFLWWAVDVFTTARADLGFLKVPHVRERLSRIFKGTPWLEAHGLDALGADVGYLNGEKYRASEAKRGWQAYKDECKLSRALSRELSELKRGQSAPGSYSLSFRDMRALAAAALHYPRLFGDAGAQWRKDHYADLWRRLTAAAGDAPKFTDWTPEQLNAWAAEAADAANSFTPKAREFAALERERAAVGRKLAESEARAHHKGFVIEQLQERLRAAGLDDSIDGIPQYGDYLAAKLLAERAGPTEQSGG